MPASSATAVASVGTSGVAIALGHQSATTPRPPAIASTATTSRFMSRS